MSADAAAEARAAHAGRASRRCLTAALCVPALTALAYGGLGAAVSLPLVVSALALHASGAARRFERVELLVMQIVLAGTLGGLFIAAQRALGGPPAFGPGVTVVGLALALPHIGLHPTRGSRATALGFGLLALMGAARAASTPVFGAAVLAYLNLALLSTLQLQSGFGAMSRHGRALLGPYALAGALTAALTAALGWALPAAEGTVTEYLAPYLGEGDVATAGFSDGPVHLGDVREIEASDEVVVRLEGAEVSYLRGQTYTTYHARTWVQNSAQGVERPLGPDGALDATADAGPAQGTVSLEVAGRLGRTVLVPDGAVRLLGLPGGATVEGAGRVYTLSSDEAETYRAELRPGAPTGLDPPGTRELEIAFAPLAMRLSELAGRLGATAPELGPAQRMSVFMRHLASFRYTLTFDELAVNANEPVMDFLFRGKAGHCELFASALALLGRAAGVPTRLVTGYVVLERNAVGEYAVVRSRDAHAWVEAYVDGTWRRYDPTPPSALAEARGPGPGWLGERMELLSRAAARALTRLQNLTRTELLATVGAVFALLLVFVAVRRRRLSREAAALHGASRFEPLLRLEALVETRGGPSRPPGRTLAAQAEALRAAGLPGAAALIERCADLRYGGQGDAAALLADIEAYLRAPEPVQR